MAYQILDLDGNVLETLQTEEQVQAIFDDLEVNAFWDDEGLAASLKENHEDVSNIKIVKRVSE